VFDVVDHLDELRCWPTGRLVAHHECLVREQRRLALEDLDVLRVLDERGQIDPTVGRDGESARTVREKLETARALESLPTIAAAAHAGRLSDDQLSSVVKLADESSDAEWAVRAPNTAPADLARLARNQVKPSVEDSRRRYEARGLRMWWTPDKGMLHLHGQLPDVMGAKFEATIQRLAERAKPAQGVPWASFEHRAADSLVGMCDAVEVAEQVETPTLASKPLLVVEVPEQGPVEIAGIPLADAVVEQLRANASVEPVLVGDDGLPVAVGSRTSGLSPKVVRAVLLRDGHCRCGNCEVRYGLHVHHIRPKSWGGSDDPWNLATVCVPAGHHPMLVPHGPWALVGNPNRPDRLQLVRVDGLTIEQAEQLGLPPPRAGPDAT
jgi:Domain of unknown function (DUF222)/HNH endonuclease